MATRSLKSGADVKRNEAVSLNEENTPLHETPSQIQHKTKSTVVKIALLTTLCLENLVVFGAISVLAPFFSTEALHRGVSGSVVGIVFGSYPLTVVLSSPIIGKLVSKYGPRLVFICGIIIGSSSLFLFGLGEVIHNAVAFTTVSLFLRIMSAIAGAALQTSKYAITMEEFPDVLTTAVGITESFGGLGLSISPTVGGFLFSIGGYKLPFIVIGFLMLSVLPLAILTFRLIREKDQEASNSLKRETVSKWQLLKIPEVIIIAMCYVAVGTSYSWFDPVLGPHLQSEVGMNVKDVGLVFFCHALNYTIFSIVHGWVGNKTYCYRCMVVFGFIGVGMTTLLLGPVPFLASTLPANQAWFIYLVMAVKGFFDGGFAVILLPMLKGTCLSHGIADDVSTNGTLSGLVVTTLYLGVTIGPTLAGVVDEKFGFPWAATVEGLICIFQALLYLLVILHEKFSRRYKTAPQIDEERKTLLKLDSN